MWITKVHRRRQGAHASGFDLSRCSSSKCLAISWLLIISVSLNSRLPAEEEGRGKPFSYQHESIPTGPWSIHLLKLDRTNQEYEVDTTLARGTIVGMETLTEQVKAWPTNSGRPVGAINGDFYRSGRNYEGDPEGIQITHGELVSGPSGKACFWIDAAGRPHTDEVQSMFRVIGPDGTSMKVGLNEERARDAAVLYTSRLGSSTGTTGGREYILEAESNEHWLPLRIGARFKARIRKVQDEGNTTLAANMIVLSLGPSMMSDQGTKLKVGDLVEISTATLPDMTGCRTAIGGGPRLVVNGKPLGGWRSPNDRHPRTAIGWNEDRLYLLLVDGRQPGLSVGMSFTELANYFVKLGCTSAVNLDGGGSASMWLFGNTVSSPSEGRERPVANGVVIVKKHREAARIND